MWDLDKLVEHTRCTTGSWNGKTWAPVRPVTPWGFWGLRQRLHDAWEVFRGRADAFRWPQGR